ncbi:MAG: glutamate racemase [Arcobacter sp.]|nr:MAG: glutamate racemase [Arcobacter sp.]
MRVGVFDSGLGGLTVVKAISETFKGAEIFYIADTMFAPYGEKTKEQILQHSLDLTNYLIEEHSIDALIVACNTATSAAISELRRMFPHLIVIGTEPGIKPAIELSKSGNIGVLATPATLKGSKYQSLVDKLFSKKEVKLFEQACPGLVEQIENGHIKEEKTILMLQHWLKDMLSNNVDTIVLGCTHYPLVSETIKDIMGSEINLIETGFAIAKRLENLSKEKGHINIGPLKINVYFTGEINLKMVDSILDNWIDGGKIKVRNRYE